MRWIVISFYTVGTPYEQEIRKLENSLIKFNLPYEFFSYQPLGMWRRNLDYKSKCILEAFDKFPDKDIVFLDADAIIRDYPILFDKLSEEKIYDAAVYYLRFRGHDELVSNTLWFSNNSKSHALVERWDNIGRKLIQVRHQECLRIAIREIQRADQEIKIYELPIEYACIFDHPLRKGKPAIIEQFQASRQLRRQVGYGGTFVSPQRFMSKT